MTYINARHPYSSLFVKCVNSLGKRFRLRSRRSNNLSGPQVPLMTKKKLSKKCPKTAAFQESHPSKSDYLAAAETCLSSFPPDELTAFALLQQAVLSAPGDWKCLSSLGELLCSAEHPAVRNEAEAVELFKRSMQINPTENPERYFNLGQLLAGQTGCAKDSELSYKQGIELLRLELVR